MILNPEVLITREHASSSLFYQLFEQSAAKNPELPSLRLRSALTDEQLERFSDKDVVLVTPEGYLTVRCTHSRALGDVNRAIDHPNLFPKYDFAKPEPNLIWRPGMELNSTEQEFLTKHLYLPYRHRILKQLRKFKKPGVLISLHNTAPYLIGDDEYGKPQEMIPFIISNHAHEGGFHRQRNGLKTSCDPAMLEQFVINLVRELRKQGLPTDVAKNLVYKGGEASNYFSTRRNPKLKVPHGVDTFQVEYSMGITHNQKTLEPIMENIIKLRLALGAAIQATFG